MLTFIERLVLTLALTFALTPPLASFFGVRSSIAIAFLFFFFWFGILAFLCWVVYVVGCAVGTEEQLTAALHILFWNQVVKANQFSLFTSGFFIAGAPGVAIFILRQHILFGMGCYQNACQM